MLWDILYLVLLVTFEYTTAHRSTALALSSPCFTVFRDLSFDHPLISLDTESSKVLQEVPHLLLLPACPAERRILVPN